MAKRKTQFVTGEISTEVRPLRTPCEYERDAKMRELYLKSGQGKRYIKNRLKFFFNNKKI